MNKQLFEEYLYQPNELPASSVAELKQIITEYPYFQTAHMLYIKSLHSNNSILYAAHLKQTACYVNDRTLLFRLIKGQHVAKRPEFFEHVPSEILHPFSEIPAEEEAAVEEDVVDIVTTPTEQASASQDIEPLNELILRRLQEIEHEHAQKDLTPLPAVNQDDTKDSDQDNDELLAFDEDEIDSDIYGEPETDSLHKKLTQGKFTPHTIEYIHNLEQKIADSRDDYFQVSGEDRTDNLQDKLIDAFLTKQPRIIPKKPTKNEEVEDISTKSVEEPEIMTETIAKIYLNQEQYEKALKIYETLSLKYPQKSIYFADKISQIKELIKKK